MKSRKIFLIVLTSALLLSGVVLAKKKKPITPSRARGIKVVSPAWVKSKLGKYKIYDVRKKAEYVEGHLPGAISVPYKEKSKKTIRFKARKDKLNLKKFPRNKRTPIIIYCNGKRCWKSYKSCIQLRRAGHKRIYWFRKGFPGWKTKGYPVD